MLFLQLLVPYQNQSDFFIAFPRQLVHVRLRLDADDEVVNIPFRLGELVVLKGPVFHLGDVLPRSALVCIGVGVDHIEVLFAILSSHP